MKSTLQAELRFSQIICSTCRHCAQRQSGRTHRSFHTAPRPRITPRSSNIGSFGSRAISDDSKTPGTARSEIGKEDHDAEETPVQLAQAQPAAQTASLASPADLTQVGNFYGSPAKRRLRSRMNKEPEPDIQTPEGWKDHDNVSLWGVDILPNASSKLHTVGADLVTGDPLDQSFSPDSGASPPSGPGDGGENPELARNAEGAVPTTETASELIESPSSAEPSRTFPPASRYYIVDEQYEEVLQSARGLLQISQSSSQPNGVESYRDHLHLQYAGKDGDLLLDNLVEDVARRLGCDLVAVDAQDIADLISRNHTNSTTAKAGRMLSYDVLRSAFFSPTDVAKPESPLEEDDEEDGLEDMMDDTDAPPSSPRIGMSILTAKPSAIFNSLISQFPDMVDGSRSEARGGVLRMVPDFFDAQKPRDDQSALSGLIYKMLKSISDRPKMPKSSTDEQKQDLQKLRARTEEQNGISQGALIVHIKDFKAIQDSSAIGRSFLSNLQKQLAQRRAKGENLLLIGSNSADNFEPFTTHRIHDSQAGSQERKSQNIVITPVLPTTSSKLALLHDRKQRIAAINLRHLWEMLRFWKPSVLSHFEPGFWRRDFSHLITPSDRSCLEEWLWSYQYTQRLASYLAGAAPKDQEADSATEHPIPIISAAISHLKHSDNTKVRWAENQSKEAKKEVPERHLTKDNRVAKIRASASKYEKRLMSGIIEAKNISTTFDDVHMPVETIDALQTLTTLSLTRPDAFRYGVLASNKIPGLLLYGPPGTGKTLAAKAVAKESGATMLEVSAADLNDMYVGESEKNVRALFSLARKLSPCVVFLDEADAMFRARSNQGPRVSHREQLNQFLKEWDGMSNDSGSAFIMVATNRPMDLDEAVLRRLPRRLLVDLPTQSDRLEILKIHLRHEVLAEDVKLKDLAKRTPFYSGSDLKNVAVAAALNAVRDENDIAKKHVGEEPYQYPETRTLTKAHFEKALEEISASISEDMSSLRDIKKFDEQYGDKRGKKKKITRLGFPVEKENEKTRDTVKVRD